MCLIFLFPFFSVAKIRGMLNIAIMSGVQRFTYHVEELLESIDARWQEG